MRGLNLKTRSRHHRPTLAFRSMFYNRFPSFLLSLLPSFIRPSLPLLSTNLSFSSALNCQHRTPFAFVFTRLGTPPEIPAAALGISKISINQGVIQGLEYAVCARCSLLLSLTCLFVWICLSILVHVQVFVYYPTSDIGRPSGGLSYVFFFFFFFFLRWLTKPSKAFLLVTGL